MADSSFNGRMSPTPTVGLRNVGSYQISGHPYITGSKLTTGQQFQADFPFITKSITVISSGTTNGGAQLRVHFNPSGSAGGNIFDNNHYITLTAAGDSVTFDTKCRQIFVTCKSRGGSDNGVELLASLTGIPTSSMYPLTGSGLTK